MKPIYTVIRRYTAEEAKAAGKHFRYKVPSNRAGIPYSEPTPAELAVNFTTATAHWVAAGLPVVDRPTYDARSAACDPCELWDANARFGLGKCKAPGCGCTKFKRWLATEQCKHPQGSRWPAVP